MQVRTIAFYNWHYPSGGCETVTHNLAHFFRAQGMRVVVYTSKLRREILTDEDREAFTFHELPNPIVIDCPANIEFLCRSLNEERVDCLIVQNAIQLPFAAIRKQTQCRVVFCLHSIPMWEAHVARHKRLSELKNPTQLRKLEFLLVRKPINLFTDKLLHRYQRLYAAFLPHIDRLIMLCPAHRDEMERLLRKSGFPGSDVPAAKYISISNPLLPAQPPTTTPKEKIVLFVGRLTWYEKRVDRLLRAWSLVERKNPGWRLVIVGDGEERADLEQLTAKLKLQRVEFAGYQQDVAPFYRRASFVCLTSSFEGYPMCFTEGQQYGAIPVTFDSFASAREITDQGRAGILVPAFDLREYARQLNAAIADPERQGRLREAAYEAHRKYDIERIGRQWLALFKEL